MNHSESLRNPIPTPASLERLEREGVSLFTRHSSQAYLFFFQRLAHCTGLLRTSCACSLALAQWIADILSPLAWFTMSISSPVTMSPSHTCSIFGSAPAFHENRPNFSS